MPSRSPRRALAVLAVGAAAVLALPGTAVAAVGTTDPTRAGAGWLVTQLVDGNHIEVAIDLNGDGKITDDERFPDYGLTADTVLALAAAQVGGDASGAATDYLETNIQAYAGAADGVGDPNGEYYAGALAKALLVADVTGRDPRSFGGVDLIARLLSTEKPSGRFSDISQYGDFSNNIGQSLAIIALQRVDPGLLTPSASEYLAGRQCLDGGPREGNVAISADQDPCAADAVSIDTTGFGFQAFVSVDQALPAARARGFLVRSQRPDGGFADQGVTNANSTGLAAQALSFGDPAAPAAAEAKQWLLDRQLGCSAPPEQQGAIAFTDGPDGTPLFDDRAVRATAQAVPGLSGALLSTVSAGGSVADAPRLDCPVPTTTPAPAWTSTPPPTATSTATSTPTVTGTATPPPPTASATTTGGPGLPVTGSPIGGMLGVGGASLALGAVLLIAARRRGGAHR